MTTGGYSTSREGKADYERLIGEYGDAKAGAMLVVVAGLHGNEPAGINAFGRVIERLHRDRPGMHGRLMGFVGNRTALEREKRFIDTDMNRIWSAGSVAALRNANPDKLSVEQNEQRDLIAHLAAVLNGHAPVIILDLHSTSAYGAPFCIISDTLQNRRVAFPWSIPVILGLEEAIDGTIQEYFGSFGHVTAAVEGGQHRDPETVHHLESVLWITLVGSGFLREKDVVDYREHRRRLAQACSGLPSVVEVFHRHGVSANNGFEMRPGFRNFSPVRKGEPVARDQDGEVVAGANGMLILPNYQNVGSDGFFLGRRVRRFWLQLSTLARQTGLARLMPSVPGVRRDPADDTAMIVGPGAPRRLTCGIFRLLGYQKHHDAGGELVFRRRREGPPAFPS